VRRRSAIRDCSKLFPARGPRAALSASPKISQSGRGDLFLPFEGDPTLSVILSKAFLLADDDKITDAAGAAGGKIDVSQEDQTKGGPMYGRDFEDPDGHQWAPMWMDPDFAEKGAHPVDEATAA